MAVGCGVRVAEKGSLLFSGSDWRLITPRNGKTVITKGANPESQEWRFYRNVARRLVKGEELVITPQWGRRLIHVLDLAARGAKRGVSLKAKYK